MSAIPVPMIRSHGLGAKRCGSVIHDCLSCSIRCNVHARRRARSTFGRMLCPVGMEAKNAIQHSCLAGIFHRAQATPPVIRGIDLDQSLTDGDGSTYGPLRFGPLIAGSNLPGGGRS
jgi:hypothetical protein